MSQYRKAICYMMHGFPIPHKSFSYHFKHVFPIINIHRLSRFVSILFFGEANSNTNQKLACITPIKLASASYQLDPYVVTLGGVVWFQILFKKVVSYSLSRNGVMGHSLLEKRAIYTSEYTFNISRVAFSKVSAELTGLALKLPFPSLHSNMPVVFSLIDWCPINTHPCRLGHTNHISGIWRGTNNELLTL